MRRELQITVTNAAGVSTAATPIASGYLLQQQFQREAAEIRAIERVIREHRGVSDYDLARKIHQELNK